MSSYLSAGVFKLKQAREYVTPTRKETAFLSKGVLTPEEFIKAGDELVFKCPTWSWERGDKDKIKCYLPSEKQFLITRNVPCMSRASSLLVDAEEEMNIPLPKDSTSPSEIDDDDESDWCISSHIRQGISSLNITHKDVVDDDFQVLSDNTTPASNLDTGTINKTPLVVEDEYADLDEFEDQNVTVDEAVVTSASYHRSTKGTTNIIKVRTYGTPYKNLFFFHYDFCLSHFIVYMTPFCFQL